MRSAVCLERSKKQFSFCLAFLVGRALRASRSNRLSGSHGVLAPPRGPCHGALRTRGSASLPVESATGGSRFRATLWEEHVWEATEKRKPL